MDDILDDFIRCAERCEGASHIFESEPVGPSLERLSDAANSLGRAWSGSWINSYANLYTEDLQPYPPGQGFNPDWGNLIKWFEYEYPTIEAEILARAQVEDLQLIWEASRTAQKAFETTQAELLPILDALLSVNADPVLSDIRGKVATQVSHISRNTVINQKMPKSFLVNMAQYNQGMRVPHHIFFNAVMTELRSHGQKSKDMAKLARHAGNYLKQKYKMKVRTMAKIDGKIFIGHGRSEAWKALKDFIQDRLKLDIDEFNRESVAGVPTVTRLEAMLDGASFGFLVMTAEDEHADTTLHARENVVHEVGLFQGRLGFSRAIVLLEEGCKEFSNINGLGQIRFPKGDIMAKSEEIRHVLEREGLL